MTKLDLNAVDDSVTKDEIAKALDTKDGDYAPFPVVDYQDTLDDARIDTLALPIPATPHQAVLNARALRDAHTFVGVGQCLAVVRGRLFKIPAMWPTAKLAIEHGAPVHVLTADEYHTAPRGGVLGFEIPGSDTDHTTLSVGGGLNSTTDQHENGYEGIATIAATAQWCGASKVVWYETLEGVDVWPDNPKPPPPAPDWWMLSRRVQFLRNEAKRQTKAGHPHRANQLNHWADQLEALLESEKKGK